jgi:N-acetylmuramoyl-L-alanine amidase
MMFLAVAWMAIALVAQPISSTAAQEYRTRTFSGRSYVAVSSLAARFDLGADRHSHGRIADYRGKTRSLAVTADQRDISVNGVAHWLDQPVLEEYGQLWIAERDVIKTVEPIFSPKKPSARVPVKTIVLDPGHGGRDHGATGAGGSTERWHTLDLAKRVEQRLKATGARVLLTRREDTMLSLEERVAYAKKNGADLFVSLHFNSGGSARGIETYCLTPVGSASTASPGLHKKSTEAGNQFDNQNVWLAHCVQKSLLDATGAEDRGVRRAGFYVIREISCPAVLVEGGFLSNRAEEQKIRQPSYRESLADGIAEGITRYLSIMK